MSKIRCIECARKRKLQLECYKNCLQASQLENEISRKKTDVKGLIENHKVFIKNIKVILKTQ